MNICCIYHIVASILLATLGTVKLQWLQYMQNQELAQLKSRRNMIELMISHEKNFEYTVISYVAIASSQSSELVV